MIRPLLWLALIGTIAATGCATSASGPMTPTIRSAAQGALTDAPTQFRNVLYVSDQLDKAVLAYPSSEKLNNPSPVETIQFNVIPEGLWVDRAGILYAALSDQLPSQPGEVQEFKPGQTSPFVTITDGIGRPENLTVGSDGTLYVDQENGLSVEILEYLPGKTSPSKTLSVSGKGQPNAGGMTLDSHGNLYVSAAFADGPRHVLVYRFAPNQTIGKNLHLRDTGVGQGLASDAQGNLYVGGPNQGISVYGPGQTEPNRIIHAPSGQVDGLFTVTRSGQLYVTSYSPSNDPVEVLEYATGGSQPVNIVSSGLKAPHSTALRAAAF